MTRIERRFIEPRDWSARVRQVLLVLAGAATVLAVATLVFGQVQLRLGDVQLFRNSHVFRPVFVAFVLATLAGRGVFAARLMVPIAILLSVVPAQAYEDTRVHLRREEHPMRSARDCVVGVRERGAAAGRTAPGIYAVGEQKWMLHSHFYYFRRLAPWERGDVLDDRIVSDGLFEPGRQRPILMDDADYQAFKTGHAEALLSVPAVRLRSVLLLMPGPYAACAPGARESFVPISAMVDTRVRVSIVIPAFNEESRLGETLDELTPVPGRAALGLGGTGGRRRLDRRDVPAWSRSGLAGTRASCSSASRIAARVAPSRPECWPRRAPFRFICDADLAMPVGGAAAVSSAEPLRASTWRSGAARDTARAGSASRSCGTWRAACSTTPSSG